MKASGCSMTEEIYRLYVAKPFSMEPMRADAFKNTFNLKNSVYGSLYENRKEQSLFIFPSGVGWEIDVDGTELNERFSTFEEAERFVKRRYAAWLARDEGYVGYLMEHIAARKTKAISITSTL